MSCHQAHNIPWHVLLECLELQPVPNSCPTEWDRQPKRCTTSEEKARLDKKMRFFIAKFDAAVQEFTATERKKYDMAKILETQQIFSDDQVNDILKKEYQDISYWKSRASRPDVSSISDGDLSEVIKELFNTNNMPALFRLAHGKVGMERLAWVTYSNLFHYGFKALLEECVMVYIDLNYLIASGHIGQPSKWYRRWKARMDDIIGSRDFSLAERRVLRPFMVANRQGFSDYNTIDDLLRYAFRVIYQFNMVASELPNYTFSITKDLSLYFMFCSTLFGFGV